MAELHDLTALEQADLVGRREVSPRELTDHYLERADRLDSVGAFVTLTPDLARDRADALVPGDDDGPLFGVPTAIKDLNETAGVRTTFGSAVFADFVPETSDGVTLSIEAAGMVSIGKTNTPEFGSTAYTEAEVAPPAVTPWDRTRTAGGSSGGAAAAVAAGLVPLAQGSDGAGSIRIPASCCGLVGLKPSRGRVSGYPAYADPVGFVTAGPLTRTVADAAAMLDVLAGHRPGDPSWAPAPADTFLSACERPPDRLRIARFSRPVLADVAVDPECLRAWEDASRLLDSLGHDVEDVEMPLSRDAVPLFEACWAVGTALTVIPPEREHLRRPITRWLADGGQALNGPVYGLVIGAIRRHAAAALTALAPYAAVLTPTLAQPPVPVGAMRDDEHPDRDFADQIAFTPYTSVWNVTGMPAFSLPLHWTPEGLPVGVMLAGRRPAEEELLISLAAQVERAAPWSERRPPGW